MKVLVTDVRYRMSVSLIRELADAGHTVYTCESDDATPIGSYSKYVTEHFTLPSKDYKTSLVKLLEKLDGAALLPVGASTLALVASDIEAFSAVAGVCVSGAKTLELLNDKAALAALARRIGVPTPAEYVGEKKYPCVVKPLCGEKLGLHAEARYVIARSYEEAEKAVLHFTSLAGEAPICQEYLSGEGAGCSVAAKNGEVYACICHKRVREYPITGGPSSCCITVSDEKLVEYTKKLVKEKNFSGVGMFEYKKNADGEWKLLECNPRVWGSFPLVRASKSSLAKCWAALAAGIEPLPQSVKTGKKMNFFPSDVIAGISYARHGKPGKFFSQIADALNPAVRDGVFELRDMKPALAYYKSMLKGKGK